MKPKQRIHQVGKNSRVVKPANNQRSVKIEEPDLLALQRTAMKPAFASPDGILDLQRGYGNQRVQRLLNQHAVGNDPQRPILDMKAIRQNAGGVVQRLTDISTLPDVAKARDDTKIKAHPYKDGDYNCHGLTFNSGPAFEYSPLSVEVPKLLNAEGGEIVWGGGRLELMQDFELKRGDIAEFINGAESAHTSRIIEDKYIGEGKKAVKDALSVKVKQRDKFGQGIDSDNLLGFHTASGYPVTIWRGLPDPMTQGGKTALGEQYRSGK